MAKYAHRTFEMYDFREEAIDALTPKTLRPATEETPPESWAFERLEVSRSAGVILIQFKDTEIPGEGTLSELHDDFDQLADKLGRDSKVLLDFACVKSFCPASIDVLMRFKQKLQTKGSRLALCNLEAAAREGFFSRRSS